MPQVREPAAGDETGHQAALREALTRTVDTFHTLRQRLTEAERHDLNAKYMVAAKGKRIPLCAPPVPRVCPPSGYR
jgi:hypothetical protein